MRATIVLFAVILLFGKHAEGTEERITGGVPALPNDFSFMASLRDNMSPVCGGVIVNPRWILSAAHCQYYGKITKIGVGNVNLDNQTLYAVENVIPYPNFDQTQKLNDIMLIKTNKDIVMQYGNVSITQVNSILRNDLQVTNLQFAGWGRTSAATQQYPNFLQATNYTMQSLSSCYYKSLQTGPKNMFYTSEIQLCAMPSKPGTGACNGDDGGPLVSNGIIYGIASKSMGDTCNSGFPDIFTRASYYYNWMISVINNN